MPLPHVPGSAEPEFHSRKDYQNAQARTAGYRNYQDWINERRAEGVNQRWNQGRAKTFKYRNGDVFRFNFLKGKESELLERYERGEELIEEIFRNAPADFALVPFVRGNFYDGAGEKPPEEWEWRNMIPANVSDFKEVYGFSDDTPLLEILRERFKIRDYSPTNRGIAEVQLAFWDTRRAKPKFQGRKKK